PRPALQDARHEDPRPAEPGALGQQHRKPAPDGHRQGREADAEEAVRRDARLARTAPEHLGADAARDSLLRQRAGPGGQWGVAQGADRARDAAAWLRGRDLLELSAQLGAGLRYPR